MRRASYTHARALHAAHLPTPMRDLALYVRVGKTGSSSIQELLLRAAVATLGASPWLCTPGMPRTNADCARAEVAFGAERLYGSGDVYKSASAWQRGRRFFATLREPVERVASEYVYFCVHCLDAGKFCGRLSSACMNNRTNFTVWVQRGPNQYTSRFSRHWPAMSYLQAYVRGFPGLAPVHMGDVDRAFATLTRPSTLLLWTDEMSGDGATQRVALDRLRAWLGGANASRAARALENVTSFPRENTALPETRYALTAAERRLVCELNWADCALYQRVRNKSCAC
jgi:hypothetical protein